MWILSIPTGNLRSPCGQFAFVDQLPPNSLKTVVLNFLAVMCRVGCAAPVIQIFRAHNLGRQPKLTRNAIDDFFNRQHSLRSAKSTERSVGREIRFRDESFELNVRNVITVIEMKDRPIGHRARKIERPTAV